MHRRMMAVAVSVFTALALVAALFTAIPAKAAPATVFVNPYIVSKAVLPQTSVDGPALWSSSSGAIRAEIAYTGTDSAHRLNVMTSAAS